MAVSKLWPVRSRLSKVINYAKDENKTTATLYNKSDLEALKDVIAYAQNEEKTEREFYVDAINCNPLMARDEFIYVKEEFDKLDGIQAYHGYLSFKEQDITPDLAHEVGMEFARRVWGKRFQILVTTHLNTHHLHCHFVINSVSFVDGKRLHGEEKAWFRFRHIADEVSKEYGLYFDEKPKRQRKTSKTHKGYYQKLESMGMPTRYSLAKSAIDEAIFKSTNLLSFEYELKKMGYKVSLNPNHKYWTIIPKGYAKPIRLKALGDEYTNEEIKKCLLENQDLKLKTFSPYQIKVRVYHLPTRFDHIKKHKGIYGLYLHYCYRLGYLPKYKKQNPNHLHPLLKEDLIKVEEFSKEMRFLSKHQIKTDEDLFDYKDELKQAIKMNNQKIEQIKYDFKKGLPKDSCRRDELTALRNSNTSYRQELKLIDRIAKRSGMIEDKLQEINKEETITKGKEKTRNEY